MTPIQAVKLSTMTVTRLPSPFDKYELELWNVEFSRLKSLLWELYKSDYIQSSEKRSLKTYKKNKKKFDRKKRSFISTSLQLQPWKNKDNDFLCQLRFLSLYLVWLVSSRNTRTRCEICSKLKDIRMTSLASIWCLYC